MEFERMLQFLLVERLHQEMQILDRQPRPIELLKTHQVIDQVDVEPVTTTAPVAVVGDSMMMIGGVEGEAVRLLPGAQMLLQAVAGEAAGTHLVAVLRLQPRTDRPQQDQTHSMRPTTVHHGTEIPILHLLLVHRLGLMTKKFSAVAMSQRRNLPSKKTVPTRGDNSSPAQKPRTSNVDSSSGLTKIILLRKRGEHLVLPGVRPAGLLQVRTVPSEETNLVGQENGGHLRLHLNGDGQAVLTRQGVIMALVPEGEIG